MENFLKFGVALLLVQQAIAIRIFRPKVTCTQNYETYNACGSACPKSCDNYNTTVPCTKQCVPGCYCNAGYVRNSDGTCCKPEECPGVAPKPEPTTCPLNQEYTECGTACPVTCANYGDGPQICTMNCVVGCQCSAGFIQKGDGSCCTPSECPGAAPEPEPEPTTCPLNQEYTECGSACPLTCSNYENPPQMCTMNCVVGCRCKSGYVRKGDGSCCAPSEC